MTAPLRIAHVAPVAMAIPPRTGGSVEQIAHLLTEGLVARGHDVTLFATGDSSTRARLHATYPRGYADDLHLWPWELCEMINLAAAVERARQFDVIHYQAVYSPMALPFTRMSEAPIVQTLHHSPDPAEVALWSRYPEAPFVAVSHEQARRLAGLNIVATVPHGIDTAAFPFRAQPDDYLLFLGRFTPGKGVRQAIEIAGRAGMRLLLSGAANEYYRDEIRPLVDGRHIVYCGEADHAAKAGLYGGARTLLYPVQCGEPFGLVLVEAMLCGTPVAALDRGAVREVIDEGVTGGIFADLDEMVSGLGQVCDLDRGRVRERAVLRFGADRMVDEYVAVYWRILEAHGVQQG